MWFPGSPANQCFPLCLASYENFGKWAPAGHAEISAYIGVPLAAHFGKMMHINYVCCKELQIL